jgi:hypothetical protein
MILYKIFYTMIHQEEDDMKKLFSIAVVVFFAMGLISMKSVNLELESCNTACEVAQKQCIDKGAKDKNGKVIEWKKAACDETAQKCYNKCTKQYGGK